MPGITVASVTATSVRRGPRESRQPRENGIPRPPQQLAGCILWLPRKEDLPNNRDEYDSDLEEDRCNHPVVVLSPQLEDGKAVYLMMTSLKGKDFETRFLNKPNVRREHLPIRPCNPHPDNGILLSLDDVSLELRKKSYVKTKTHHRILLSSLRPYDRHGPEYALSRKSYHQLIQHAKFSPPIPHPSSNTVSSPRHVQQPNPTMPITRERRGSYGEYVSALRGLDSPASPPRAQHSPITSPTPVRYTRTTAPSERDSLLPSHGYPRQSYTSYPGSYPASSPGAHPAYGYRPSAQAGYRVPGTPEPSNRATFWKRLIRLLFFIVAFGGAYLAYRCVGWLVGVAKETGSVMKVMVDNVGNRIGGLWLTLSRFSKP
ncbi:hypothetical protein F4781DRAFT_185467 [Annulohypoxylon bovei var. microspora]|nr:hypothetical protein F4781DRAFT_185467 [Annulohypoxylon bovei var. microspora]